MRERVRACVRACACLACTCVRVRPWLHPCAGSGSMACTSWPRASTKSKADASEPCVYRHVYEHVCRHVCGHVCRHARRHVQRHLHAHVCGCLCRHVYEHVRRRAHGTFIHMCIEMCKCARLQAINEHECVRACSCACVHVCMRERFACTAPTIMPPITTFQH